MPAKIFENNHASVYTACGREFRYQPLINYNAIRYKNGFYCFSCVARSPDLSKAGCERVCEFNGCITGWASIGKTQKTLDFATTSFTVIFPFWHNRNNDRIWCKHVSLYYPL